jgi:DNA topoisomerase-1
MLRAGESIHWIDVCALFDLMPPHRRRTLDDLPTDPYESAKVAGLRYVNDDERGISRQRKGDGFICIGPDGKPVEDEETLARIRSLVIPPAWEDVWICVKSNGHIQAVGRDARGRKQYRYHPLYRAVRDATKFTRMIAFSEVLPEIRKRVEHDLKLPGLSRNKVLATVVQLLERTCIRVGNDEYVRENGSFGLTTLRNRHVSIEGATLRFHFKGKSGVKHDIELTDRKLARIVRECQCIPGHDLFEYTDAEGNICRVRSEDVNEYLREIAGQDFTAKDFRTWHGTAQAALELEALGACDSDTQAKKNIVAAIKGVASRLGNRPATCRKYYVHPAILEAYADGSLIGALKLEGDTCWQREEVAVIKLVSAYKATSVTEVKPRKAA